MGFKNTMEDIKDNMAYGNWKDAQDEFERINPTGAEFASYIQDLEDNCEIEAIKDFALLGFYARTFKPCE